MADSWGDNDDYNDPWSDSPDLNTVLFGNDLDVDRHAQELFMSAFFDGNDTAYVDLVSYMWDEYGIDFEDAFDWEDFREWYKSQ